MKIKVWVDSGANIHSKNQEIVNLKDWGISDEEWNAMTDDEKFEVVNEWAQNYLDIGYEEL